MRLSVFIVDTLSIQLMVDLQKIYADYLSPANLTEQVIQQQLEAPSSRLYMTMFNERHIGAATVTIDDKKATLSQLTIRDLTRRRGVGKNLLAQIQTSLTSENITQIQYNLNEVNKADLLTMHDFLLNSGYTVTGNIAIKNISPAGIKKPH